MAPRVVLESEAAAIAGSFRNAESQASLETY